MSSDTLTTLGLLLATFGLVLGCALFVFHEFAYVVIKPFQIRQLEESSRRVGHLVAKAAHSLDHYIAVDQLGITATNLAAGWIGQPVVADLVAPPLEALGVSSGAVSVIAFILAVAVVTVLLMVVGELMPKTVALRHPREVASLTALPVEIIARITHPLVWLLNGLGGLTVRLFGLTPQAESHTHTLEAEELEVVIRASARAGVLRANPDVLRRALRFSDIQANDVMLPRQDLTAVEIQMPVEEVLEVARRSRHTRYPVYVDTIDNISGLLNIKELIQIQPDGHPTLTEDWQELVRPIPTLPEYASIEQVMAELSQQQQQMALLIDEYGGPAGVITVTDIASRLIPNANAIREIRAGRYLVAGDTNLEELEAVLGVELLNDEPRDFETVGGLIMAELNRVPQTGDEVQLGDLRLRVTVMRGRRVMQVMLDAPKRSQHAVI